MASLIHVKFLLCARCCVKLFFFFFFLATDLVSGYFSFLAVLVLQVAASGLSLVAAVFVTQASTAVSSPVAELGLQGVRAQ